MALCLVHTAAGYVGYESIRPPERHRPALLAAAVLLANGADLDFLPGIVIGHPAQFHRGVTHTLAAVVAVGVVVWLVRRVRVRDRVAALRAGGWAAAVYASHLALDFVTTDARPPYGGRFLWPLSDAYYLSPVTPLREVLIDPSGRGAFFRSLFQPETRAAWVEEVLILALTVMAVHGLRAWRGATADTETDAVGDLADSS
jgi:membrane-bound metal-dependent hydrolase YbcI (DUF457 family)